MYKRTSQSAQRWSFYCTENCSNPRICEKKRERSAVTRAAALTRLRSCAASKMAIIFSVSPVAHCVASILAFVKPVTWKPSRVYGQPQNIRQCAAGHRRMPPRAVPRARRGLPAQCRASFTVS
ncbi:hypothetical protein EVAR_78158_1 [Eumeta japonica]|uniref:Uncharacterized protein n=1 Tax=Eumeta variegata TaxID=151549 RepID=A0A4C1UZC2_EUMVA|nr:hypothetical protein EVAR_78158_1 [Eumeta japonica]